MQTMLARRVMPLAREEIVCITAYRPGVSGGMIARAPILLRSAKSREGGGSLLNHLPRFVGIVCRCLRVSR